MSAPLESAAQELLKSTGVFPMHLIGRLVTVDDMTEQAPFTAVFVGFVKSVSGNYNAAVRRLTTSEVEAVHPSRISKGPHDSRREAHVKELLVVLRTPLIQASRPDRERCEEIALHDAITATELLECAWARARSR